MKLNKLSLACAAAIAAMSSPAGAVVITDAPDLEIMLSGASAPDNFLDSLATGIYDAGFLKYVDSIDQKQFRAFFGTIKSATDIPATLIGKKVRFIKRSQGGSVWGVDPVARAEGIQTLAISSTATCPTGTGTVADPYVCSAAGTDPALGGSPDPLSRVPTFGVSDVPPYMFKEPFNTEFGKSQLSPSALLNLNSSGKGTAVNVLSMGIVVTNVIGASTVISRTDYGGMLTGDSKTWAKIGATNPTAGSQVVVCRRVPGSGTQTSYNWFFNNFPCTSGDIAVNGFTTPARMSDSAGYPGDPGDIGCGGSGQPVCELDVGAGYTVLENSTSGNVRDCITKANKGGIHTFKDEQGNNWQADFGTGGFGAIAVLSVDSLDDKPGTQGPTSAADGWSYRFLDGAGEMFDTNSASGVTVGFAGPQTGVAPTKSNLREGRYDFGAELSMQYRVATVNGLVALNAGTDNPAAPNTNSAGQKTYSNGTLAKTFVDFFIARAGNPSFNTSEWVAALPPTYSPAGVGGANVAKGSRQANMCAPIKRFFQ